MRPSQQSTECKEDEVSSEAVQNDDKAHIKLANITVTVDLSKDAVKRLLQRHMHAINQCYTETLGQQSSPKGRVVVRITIDAKGDVTKVRIKKGKQEYKKFERCLLQKLKTLQFPTLDGGKQSVITITFTMS